MTNVHDQPPLSRRALRQAELESRAAAEEIDDAAETDRPAPSGRRARAASSDQLVEVPTTTAIPTVSDSDADAASGDSASSALSTADAAAEPAEPVRESAIPTAFPFAEQVEATSDDAGHPGFRLRDFSPELGTARAESTSAADWAPAGSEESVPLDYHTQGGPAGAAYVSPYSRRAMRAEAPAVAPEAAPVEEPSFDSLFADLTLDAQESESETDVADDAVAPADSVEPAPEPAPVPVAEPIVVSEPVALVEPLVVQPEERTLSRREWRAMRAKAEAEAAAAAAAGGVVAEAEPAETDSEDAAAVDAPAEGAAEHAEPEHTDTPAEAAPSGVDVFFQAPVAEPADDTRTPDAPAAEFDPASIPPLVEPSTEPHTDLSDAMAEFEALTRGVHTEPAPGDAAFPAGLFAEPVVAEPVTDQPTPSSDEHGESSTDEAAPDSAPAEPAAEKVDFTPSADTVPPPASSAPFSFLLSPPPAAAPPADAPVAPALTGFPPPSAPSTTAQPAGEPSSEAQPTTGSVSSYQPPVGHWSRQAEMDDESQPFENTLSRDVGGGNVATTTNALVLPMIPQRDDFSSVLNATGEIMVTGTINLPGSVGTTGRDSRHYDDPEVDHLFDAFDNEVANTDSAPVRAITAVSSHTATRGGIEMGRSQSNRMLTVLLVTAGVMAVSVLGLLVAGFVFNIF
ncbi:hypothetical protein HD599_001837 [Conyzicola lurida]|uniref:Uncharacterized protein n=1 Tax=Conyzicola lurida TaxID=1172621 RepID=A0A841AMF8_9MICO|nr:hypothetical protein [Conyzicola lurida]MBB5843514.1 hypothetical protein [Conyzicola lurida]